MKDFHKMPQKDFPDSNTMKDFHKMPQKNFPDSNTMKDFHKMPQKDFPDFTTMKDFHNPESESTFTAFSGFSNHSRILRHFAAFSTSIKKLEDFESSAFTYDSFHRSIQTRTYQTVHVSWLKK